MTRIDRLKRSLGTAVRRTSPSRAAEVIVAAGLARGRVLDYGCGFGFDADHFGWYGFDPYYRPREPSGLYDTVLCTLVLNVLTRKNRARVLARIRELLAPDGHAYLAVARDVPRGGKLGVQNAVVNYVVLSLPVVHEDESIAIYDMQKAGAVDDLTRDFVSRRDARRDR